MVHCLDFFRNGIRISQRALISTEQCYILKQINNEPSVVTQRITYRFLRSIVPVEHHSPSAVEDIELTFSPTSEQGSSAAGTSGTDVVERKTDTFAGGQATKLVSVGMLLMLRRAWNLIFLRNLISL